MTTKHKIMLVEGKDDQFSVINLMEAHGILFGRDVNSRPVNFEIFGEATDDAGGISKLLKEGYLSAKLKTPDATIGIIVDADNDAAARWAQIRHRCSPAFENLPEQIDPAGLIVTNATGETLGVWIMPDNSGNGMMETFLLRLVPDPPLLDWAKESTNQATQKGAKFAPVHLEKAQIHTWLAWQEEPGKPFGIAIKAKYFDAASPHAQPFVAWFRKLFAL